MRLPLLLLLAACTAPLGAAGLAPFEASYEVVWKGMAAGASRLELRRGEGDRWIYQASNQARGVFRVALPNGIRQTSTFRVRDGRIVPEHFVADDGTEAGKRDSDIRFDWTAQRATGSAEGRAVDVALEGEVQDGLSVQIAMIHELLQGRTPSRFLMLDKNVVKDYEYTREGTEQVETALGTHEAVIYRSRRPDADRSTVFWCAPSLGFLPLKVERHRGRKVEWSMRLKDAKLSEASP